MKSSNAIAKILAAVLWCGVSVGCVAEEAKKTSPDVQKAEAASDYYLLKDKRVVFERVIPADAKDVCNVFMDALATGKIDPYQCTFDPTVVAGFSSVMWKDISDDKTPHLHDVIKNLSGAEVVQLSEFDINNDGKNEIILREASRKDFCDFYYANIYKDENGNLQRYKEDNSQPNIGFFDYGPQWGEFYYKNHIFLVGRPSSGVDISYARGLAKFPADVCKIFKHSGKIRDINLPNKF